MNEFSFKVLDLISRIGVDNSCWGVCDGFNRQSFDIDESDVYYEGRFLYVWDPAIGSYFTDEQKEEFEMESFTQIIVLNHDDSLCGVYFFFNLD